MTEAAARQRFGEDGQEVEGSLEVHHPGSQTVDQLPRSLDRRLPASRLNVESAKWDVAKALS
jgi:hypothetical protein